MPATYTAPTHNKPNKEAAPNPVPPLNRRMWRKKI